MVVLSALLFAECLAQKLPATALTELEAAEKMMFNSFMQGDSALFRKISAPDYFTINAAGVSQTLNEAIVWVPRFKGSTVVLSEQNSRVYGNFALRTGRLKGYFDDKHVAEILYTAGWVYRDKHWQFVHWQGTYSGLSLKEQHEPPKN